MFRYHTDRDNLLQMIYMIMAGYFEDDASDELTNDPVFKAVLEKSALASQPTVSGFFNRMDEDTLKQFQEISRILRKRLYSIQMPQAVILDLDSTLLAAYGKQEGRAFNFHYQSNGYHPLVCYDGITGDLIKIQLRDGAAYSCTGVTDFLQPILDEYRSIGQYFVGNHDLLSLSSNSFIIARSIPEELDMLKPEKSLLFDSDMGKFFIASNGKMSEIAYF